MEAALEASAGCDPIRQLWSRLCQQTTSNFADHLQSHLSRGKDHWIQLDLNPISITGSASFGQELVEKLVSVSRRRKYDGIYIVQVVGIVFGELHECFLVILFLSLTWFASASIQAINEEVEKYRRLFIDDECHQLFKWQQSYCRILNFIDEVDNVFGPALFILISRQMILFIAYFSLIYELLEKNKPFPVASVCYNIRNIFLLLALVTGSQQMKNKVISSSQQVIKSNKLIKNMMISSHWLWPTPWPSPSRGTSQPNQR